MFDACRCPGTLLRTVLDVLLSQHEASHLP